jgi:hypothetical protein
MAKKSSKKFAALAPPYNKVTYADKIAGAKKNTPKMAMGGCVTPRRLSKGK